MFYGQQMNILGNSTKKNKKETDVRSSKKLNTFFSCGVKVLYPLLLLYKISKYATNTLVKFIHYFIYKFLQGL